MILTQDLNDALNEQIVKEYQNMLIYKKIESYLEEMELHNLAKMFHKQAKEEDKHAKGFIDYLNGRIGGSVRIGEIPSPENIQIDSSNSIGSIYLRLEQETTESIEEIYELAMSQRSFLDLPYLQKMLEDQYHEEKEAQNFSKRFAMVKDLVLFDATFGDK